MDAAQSILSLLFSASLVTALVVSTSFAIDSATPNYLIQDGHERSIVTAFSWGVTIGFMVAWMVLIYLQ
jgi:hypothetical protein